MLKKIVVWNANHQRKGKKLVLIKTVEDFQSNVQGVRIERIINLWEKEVQRQYARNKK